MRILPRFSPRLTLLFNNKIYYGSWPRNKEKDLQIKFLRMLKPLEGEKEV
jgi:hypothetical protein